VVIDVVDVVGRRVVRLYDGNRQPGYYEVVWDGNDRYGEPVASGLYFCSLISGRTNDVHKMILIR